jgi:hypothetical protein
MAAAKKGGVLERRPAAAALDPLSDGTEEVRMCRAAAGEIGCYAAASSF